MKFKLVSLLIVSLVLGTLTGCKSTPTKQAIAQKGDVSALVEANTTKVGNKKIREVLKAPETDSFEMVSKSGNTTVKVDAKVVIPDTNGIKVAKVVSRDLSTLDLEGLCDYFFDGKECQVSRPLAEMSKEELGKLIKEEKARMEDASTYEGFSEEEKENLKKQNQEYLLELQEYYDKAPETVEEVPVEFKLKPVENERVGENAKRFSVEAQEKGVFQGLSILTGEYYNTVDYMFGETQCGFSGYFDGYENKCKYSEEEAKKKCEEVIKLLGVTGEFQLAQCLPIVTYSEDFSTVSDYYSGYQITYKRVLDNVQETSEGQSLWTKSFESQSSESGTDAQLPKDYERIIFQFNEEGLSVFSWKEPMKVEKVLAENVKLISYDEAIKIFKEEAFQKSMMLAEDLSGEQSEDQQAQETQKVTHKIDEIKLGYMRVQNKDNDGEYTLIPVWDFFNTSGQKGGNSVFSYLTINAIDGSIIDRGLGY